MATLEATRNTPPTESSVGSAQSNNTSPSVPNEEVDKLILQSIRPHETRLPTNTLEAHATNDSNNTVDNEALPEKDTDELETSPLITADRKRTFQSIQDFFGGLERPGSIQTWLRDKTPNEALRYIQAAEAKLEQARTAIANKLREKSTDLLHPEIAQLDSVESQIAVLQSQVDQLQIDFENASRTRNRARTRTEELHSQINSQLDAIQDYPDSFPQELINGKDFSQFPAILDQLEQVAKDKLSSLVGKVADKITPHRMLGQLSAHQMILIAEQLRTDVTIWQTLKNNESFCDAAITDHLRQIADLRPQLDDLLQQRDALSSHSRKS